MKTIAIVGAGPGLGLSVAKKFGRHGFRVALIARTQTTLDALVGQLKEQHIEANGFRADIKDTIQLRNAFADIKEMFGSIDVMDYNRGPSEFSEITSVLDLTHESVQIQLQNHLFGAITSVQEVLPTMLEENRGALFFTSGLSSIVPMFSLANLGIAMSGLRNYAHCLHDALTDKNIYVGHLVIATGLKPRLDGDDPDLPATLLYNMYEQRKSVEEVYRGQ